MTNDKETSMPSAWTEVEYSARCVSPFITTHIYIPEETSYFLCREDGSREQQRLTFVVFRAEGADEDDWEDDPMIGRLDICVLGEGDEDVKPVEAVYLGVAPESFVSVVSDDEQEIVLNISWPYGNEEIERARKTDEGWAIRKEDFGEEGIVCRLTPRRGNPFSIRLQIPYVGFSLTDADGNKLTDDIDVTNADAASLSYSFVGDSNNDRFQLSLDEGKLNYMCVLNEEGTLSVRNMRERLALVKEISAQGSLANLLMGAHSALVKNKSMRWRIQLVGDNVEGIDDVELNGKSLARFAFELFAADGNTDEDSLAQRLTHMEQKLGFEWYWLSEDDWNHENLEGLIDMEGIDADPEKMMRQALLFNRYESFMRRLTAFSYISQKPLQGDQLQARNNKRKIARCVRHVLAHRAGEENIWELDDEARREILHFHDTFHREFTAQMEE